MVRFIRKTIFCKFILVGLGACLLLHPSTLIKPVYADSHGEIRLYKLNKKGQLVKQRWLGDAENQVCQNTKKSRKVHRISQIGFDYCQFYSAENCNSDSVLAAMWAGKRYKSKDIDIKKPQEKLYKGSEWYLHFEQNVEIKSWICSY